MIERINTVLRELHTQLVSEIANGRDAYFGPGFQEAVKTFSKLYLSGDVHLVLEKARKASGRIEQGTTESEVPEGFLRLQLVSGGELAVRANLIGAVLDVLDANTLRPIGSRVYVAGVEHGAQVRSVGAEVFEMIARAQGKKGA